MQQINTITGGKYLPVILFHCLDCLLFECFASNLEINEVGIVGRLCLFSFFNVSFLTVIENAVNLDYDDVYKSL